MSVRRAAAAALQEIVEGHPFVEAFSGSCHQCRAIELLRAALAQPDELAGLLKDLKPLVEAGYQQLNRYVLMYDPLRYENLRERYDAFLKRTEQQ